MAHCGNLSVALYVTPALATRFDPSTKFQSEGHITMRWLQFSEGCWLIEMLLILGYLPSPYGHGYDVFLEKRQKISCQKASAPHSFMNRMFGKAGLADWVGGYHWPPLYE